MGTPSSLVEAIAGHQMEGLPTPFIFQFVATPTVVGKCCEKCIKGT